ncbi:MAG: ParA family protein [Burkholderiales bacterium]
MTRILAITNQKGGVGKTTTTVNPAAGLAGAGKRVLVIDLDPQGNATMGSGIDKRSLPQSVYQVLLGLSALDSVTQASTTGGYDIVPANRELAGAEVEMVSLEHRETRLKTALDRIGDKYDFVLLDCPPALNLLTLNGLVAADAVVIPMQCEYYALEGLSDLVNTIRKVRAHFNPRLEIEGLLRTMFDARNLLSQQVSAQLEQHFGAKVYATIIPRNVRLAEAPSYGTPAVTFDASCKGSQAYVSLAEEILRRAGVAPAPAEAQ